MSEFSKTCTNAAFRGPSLTIEVTRPDIGGAAPPMFSECILAAQEAWRRLSSGHTRQDWFLVGKALQLLRVEAMRTAHTNKPEGRRYNGEYSDLLRANGFAGSTRRFAQSFSSSSTTSRTSKNGWRLFPQISG